MSTKTAERQAKGIYFAAGDSNSINNNKKTTHNTGHRRIRAGTEVGRRPGNGAGRRNAGKQHTHNVGNTLADEFGIGVMVVAAHTVHNSGTEQRFYTGQKRYGQTARQNLQHQIDVKAGQLRFGAENAAHRQTCFRWCQYSVQTA